jgi:hypothetical protein
MTRNSTTATALPPATMSPVGKALEEVSASFDRFCLAAGIEALGEMMERDAAEACGARHSRAETRRGYRWGRTQGKIGFHGGKTEKTAASFSMTASAASTPSSLQPASVSPGSAPAPATAME